MLTSKCPNNEPEDQELEEQELPFSFQGAMIDHYRVEATPEAAQ